MFSQSQQTDIIYKELQSLKDVLFREFEGSEETFISKTFKTKSFGNVTLSYDKIDRELILSDNDERQYLIFDSDGRADTQNSRVLSRVAEIIKEIKDQLSSQPASIENENLPQIINDIPIFTIKLEGTDYYVPELSAFNLLRNELKKAGLYGDDFLYTAFRNDDLNLMLKTGTYLIERGQEADFIFANKVRINRITKDEEIGHNDHTSIFIYLDRRQKGDERYFAVYNKSHFTEGKEYDTYEFKNPDDKLKALVAIVKISDFNSINY